MKTLGYCVLTGFFFSAICFSLARVAAGQILPSFALKMSTSFPLKPVVFMKGIKIIASFLSRNLILLQVRVVSESKEFSCAANSSPILHEEKKTNHASSPYNLFRKSCPVQVMNFVAQNI